jgi:hypothetical protein
MDLGAGRPMRVLRLTTGLTAVATLMIVVGCSSARSSGSASHGGVTIRGHDIAEVVVTTREVFQEHDFRLARAETDRMIFERPGSKAEQVKYGSFGSTTVTIRAKVDVQDMGADTFFLRCDVFSVRDAGQSVLEDETRLILISAKSYQAIMDEIAARLPPPGSSVETQPAPKTD